MKNKLFFALMTVGLVMTYGPIASANQPVDNTHVTTETVNPKTDGSTQVMTDTYITTKVKAALIKNELMGKDVKVPAMQISVETQNGVVSLTGNVATDEQKLKAEKITKGIDGVKEVKSTLTVNPTK